MIAKRGRRREKFPQKNGISNNTKARAHWPIETPYREIIDNERHRQKRN